MRRIIFLLFLTFLTIQIFSQVSSLPGFTKTKSGIHYLTMKKGSDIQIIDENYVSIDYMLYTKDTVIYSSYSQGVPHVTQYNSVDSLGFSFNSLLHLMAIGDSTLFIVNADSIFKGKEIPPYVKINSNVFYTIKLHRQQSKQEFEAESKKQKDLMESLAAQERNILNQFIKENNIIVKPEPSGLFYIEKKKGKGRQPVKGSTVFLYFKCYLLNGKEIYKSCRQCKPLDYMLGSGQLLKGVEEGLYKMCSGGKARLILPSSLAYGAAGYQTVASYSTLIIDIELVKVK